MPTSTILILTPTTDVTLPATMGHLAHGAFLNLVRQVDPNLAQKLHEQPRNMPFTCSRLRGRRKGKTGPDSAPSLHFPAGRTCWLRYTILDEALFEVFTRRFLEAGELSLRLGSGTFHIAQVRTLGDADDDHAWSLWTGYAPYEELWEEAEPARRWAFHFASPTAFRVRRGGKGTESEVGGGPESKMESKTARSITFPEPRRCFQSWLSRWNEFSPYPFERDPLLDFVEEHVIVTEHRLQTRMMQFPRTKMAGFVGEAVFEVEGASDEERLRQLDALAYFAFFAGTGYGTPRGMGQTRRGG